MLVHKSVSNFNKTPDVTIKKEPLGLILPNYLIRSIGMEEFLKTIANLFIIDVPAGLFQCTVGHSGSKEGYSNCNMEMEGALLHTGPIASLFSWSFINQYQT